MMLVSGGERRRGASRLGGCAATILFLDFVGASSLRGENGTEEGVQAKRNALAEHVDDSITRCGGRTVATVDTGVAVSFESGLQAVAYALDLQRSLATSRPAVDVRIGIHTGEANPRDERSALAEEIGRASRICSLAHAGQTLLDRSTHELVGDRLPESTTLRDLGRQRLRDLSHTENVWQLCHPDLRDEFPPPRSLDAVPNNLPIQTTSFIGREREAADVKRHLASTRLLTITGAGGCGKTRLSFEAAADIVEAFADGVWWVDLASITDPLLVPKTVASAVGVQEIPNQPILDTLARSLHDRQTLILLDNCEHVIEASADLAQRMLSTTLSTTMLATSREPLGVSGELTFRIPSLSFPPDSPSATIASLSQYEAVRLFIDRALRAHSDFRATNENAPAIAEICHRLDGIPLAIELAAARTRVLTPDLIAAGLGDVFHVLTGGARTALPRQRTIEASIDWSHELLTPEERTFFRRLSVFAGGFTLEGAERVCSGDGLESAKILDLLTGLVDKSLVQIDNEPRGVRYRLLETIRHYAQRMLHASGDAAASRTRHLNFMLVLCERASPELEGKGHLEWVDALDPDLDNVRAALEWGLEQEDGAAALRIVSSLWLYWEARGVAEGLSWLRAALAIPSNDRQARAAALLAAGLLSLTIGDPLSSLGYADEAVALSRETQPAKVLVRALAFAGITRVFLDPANARPLLDESVKLGGAIGDSFGLAEALVGLGCAELWGGSPADARPPLEEAYVTATAAGAPVLISRTLLFLGWAMMELTELTAAHETLAAANAIATAARARFWMNFSRSLLAVVDLLEGSVDVASAELARSAGEAVELVSGFGVGIALWCAGQAARASGDLETSAETFSQGISMQGATGLRWLEAWSLASLAELEVAHGDPSSARAHVDQAESVLQAVPNPLAEGRVCLARAAVAAAADDLEAAEDAVREALRPFTACGHRQGVVDAIERLAWLLARLESHDEAARLLAAARRARSAIGYVRFPADEPAVDETERGCRGALGDEAFEAAAAEGTGLSLDQAVAYAGRGRGARKRPSTGWASLTPAELDVVRLVAEGLTNAAIGKRLFVSPRTVQAHLARVFAKLSVGSRTEVASEAIRRGLTSV